MLLQAADAAAEAAAAREEAEALAAAAAEEEDGSGSLGKTGSGLGDVPDSDPSAFDAGNFGFFGQVLHRAVLQHLLQHCVFRGLCNTTETFAGKLQIHRHF